jgi:hypothetical protein
MARNDNNILVLLGFNCTGDLGPYTFYRSRRGKRVFFPRAPALNPPSTIQKIMRQRFRNVATIWRALTTPQRADWEAASITCRLRCTGYNLFLHYRLTGNNVLIDRVETYTGIVLNRG